MDLEACSDEAADVDVGPLNGDRGREEVVVRVAEDVADTRGRLGVIPEEPHLVADLHHEEDPRVLALRNNRKRNRGGDGLQGRRK